MIEAYAEYGAIGIIVLLFVGMIQFLRSTLMSKLQEIEDISIKLIDRWNRSDETRDRRHEDLIKELNDVTDDINFLKGRINGRDKLCQEEKVLTVLKEVGHLRKLKKLEKRWVKKLKSISMNKAQIDKWRENVDARLEELTIMNAKQNSQLFHIDEILQDIKSMVKEQNGRVRTLEQQTSAMKAIGSIVAVAYSAVITWLFNRS